MSDDNVDALDVAQAMLQVPVQYLSPIIGDVPVDLGDVPPTCHPTEARPRMLLDLDARAPDPTGALAGGEACWALSGHNPARSRAEDSAEWVQDLDKLPDPGRVGLNPRVFQPELRMSNALLSHIDLQRSKNEM